MTILVTGVAGFIGSYVAHDLLARGESVVGIDNLNDYYDAGLKNARIESLIAHPAFTFEKLDFADNAALQALGAEYKFDRVVHLGAQAGVRHSLENPSAYIQANMVGYANILELCRHITDFKHLVYASSSSVYAGSPETPFNEAMTCDTPVSLYAATKRSNELLSQSYAHLYGIAVTGLRFFTVYGPWGRPDMAPWLFTDAILNGRPIKVFNNGDMRRDFTYIDDIVEGVISALDLAPISDGTEHMRHSAAPHRIFNLGNNKPVALMDFIHEIELATGREAEKIMLPMQDGDVIETYADLSKSRSILGFQPKTSLSEGIPKFVDWFRAYKGL